MPHALKYSDMYNSYIMSFIMNQYKVAIKTPLWVFKSTLFAVIAKLANFSQQEFVNYEGHSQIHVSKCISVFKERVREECYGEKRVSEKLSYNI